MRQTLIPKERVKKKKTNGRGRKDKEKKKKLNRIDKMFEPH